MRNWLLTFLVTVPAIASVDSPVLAGSLVGVVMAIGGIGNLTGGWASDRFGRTRTVAVALAISGSISFSLIFLRGLPLWTLTPVLLLYGMALTADSAPVSTLVTEVVDDDRVSTALSLQSLVGFSATVVSPILFGIAFSTLAFGALMGLVSIGTFARTATAAQVTGRDYRIPNPFRSRASRQHGPGIPVETYEGAQMSPPAVSRLL